MKTSPLDPRKGSVLVLIPAFNEEQSLPAVVPGVRQVLPEATVLVVDDGSWDRTSDVARRLGARVVRHPVNLGYGAALQTGYRFALLHGYSCVLQMDADGQHEPSCLRDLLRALEEDDHDLVLGSRFLEGSARYGIPWARRVGMVVFSAISGAVLGRRISDPTTGFQALRAPVVRFYAEGAFFPPDFPDADVLIRTGRAGFRVGEIPVTMHAGEGPSMHGGLRPVYYVCKMLLSILIVLTVPRSGPGEEVR